MKIRFLHPATARLNFAPGDELTVRVLTPELQSLLSAARLDGAHVAAIVGEDDEEVADVDARQDEQAVLGRGRRGAPRSSSVSG